MTNNPITEALGRPRADRIRILALMDKISPQLDHLDDHDLERYHLGMVTEDAEIDRMEQHLIACVECVRRAEETQDYVDAIQAATSEGNLDLEYLYPACRARRSRGAPRRCWVFTMVSARMPASVGDQSAGGCANTPLGLALAIKYRDGARAR
jgi:hypothetical protein